MKQFFAIIVGVFLCAGPTLAAAPFKIGAVLPLSGKLADYGLVAQRVLTLKADELTARGILVEVVYEDHQCDPKAGLAAAQKLVTVDQVKVVIAATCSGVALSLAPVLAEQQTFLFATVVTAKSLTNISPFTYRFWAPDGDSVKALSQHLRLKKFRRVAVLQEKTEYTQSLLDGLVAGAKLTKFEVEAFAPKETDYRTYLTRLMSKRPSAVFLNTQSPATAAAILRQAQELGFLRGRQLLLNDALLNSGEFLSANRKILEGAIGATFIVPTNPRLRRLEQSYQARFGEPIGKPSVAAVMADTIEIATSLRELFDEPEQLRQAMTALQYRGISGMVKFDNQHDLKAKTLLVEVRDGQLRPKH